MSREPENPMPPVPPRQGGGEAYPSGTPPYGAPTDPAFSRAGAPQGPRGAQQVPPAAGAGDEPKATETTLTTRIKINIPGSRPIPPVVVREPVNPAQPGTGTEGPTAPSRRHRGEGSGSPVLGVMDSGSQPSVPPDLPPEWRTPNPAAASQAPAGAAQDSAGGGGGGSSWFAPRKKVDAPETEPAGAPQPAQGIDAFPAPPGPAGSTPRPDGPSSGSPATPFAPSSHPATNAASPGAGAPQRPDHGYPAGSPAAPGAANAAPGALGSPTAPQTTERGRPGPSAAGQRPDGQSSSPAGSPFPGPGSASDRTAAGAFGGPAGPQSAERGRPGTGPRPDGPAGTGAAVPGYPAGNAAAPDTSAAGGFGGPTAPGHPGPGGGPRPDGQTGGGAARPGTAAPGSGFPPGVPAGDPFVPGAEGAQAARRNAETTQAFPAVGADLGSPGATQTHGSGINPFAPEAGAFPPAPAPAGPAPTGIGGASPFPPPAQGVFAPKPKVGGASGRPAGMN
ncbi:hypothetical protein ACFP3V_29960, partial [Streptacidiphilus monticola]